MAIGVLAVALLLGGASPGQAEVLNDDQIVALVKAGLGPDAIIAKINTSPTSFDLATTKLIALKDAGVPDPVISAMIQSSRQSVVSTNAVAVSDSPNPTSPHAPGIYALDTWDPNAKMIRMDAVTASQMKMTGMLGYAFSYGLAKMKFKIVLPNQSARIKVFTQRPTFFLYFEDASAGYARGAPNGWLGLFGASTTTPAGFTLVRFDLKNGNREATTGQFNITGMQSGVMDKARVAFSYSDVAPGVFKMTAEQDLPPGEYGFVFAPYGAGAAYGANMSRIFDFEVTAPDAGPSSK